MRRATCGLVEQQTGARRMGQGLVAEGVVFITSGVRSDRPDETFFNRNADGASHGNLTTEEKGLGLSVLIKSVYRCLAAGSGKEPRFANGAVNCVPDLTYGCFYGCFLVIEAHGGTWFRTPCPITSTVVLMPLNKRVFGRRPSLFRVVRVFLDCLSNHTS